MYKLVYMKMTGKTQAWGNSTGTRLPKKVLDSARWQDNQEFEIEVKNRSIILTPVIKDKHKNLEELVSKINPSNTHNLEDWGEPQGKELW